eukprot:10704932-Alexandrium_andersonii.AAC.1
MADNNTVQGIGKNRRIPAPLFVPSSSPGRPRGVALACRSASTAHPGVRLPRVAQRPRPVPS